MNWKWIFPSPKISCHKFEIWNISTHYILLVWYNLQKISLYTVVPLGGIFLSKAVSILKLFCRFFMLKFLVTEGGGYFLINLHIFLITLISFPLFDFPQTSHPRLNPLIQRWCFHLVLSAVACAKKVNGYWSAPEKTTRF